MKYPVARWLDIEQLQQLRELRRVDLALSRRVESFECRHWRCKEGQKLKLGLLSAVTLTDIDSVVVFSM